MKLTSWNVNSLKMRLPRLLAWLAEADSDVVNLKTVDEVFPHAELLSAGYAAVSNGRKTSTLAEALLR